MHCRRIWSKINHAFGTYWQEFPSFISNFLQVNGHNFTWKSHWIFMIRWSMPQLQLRSDVRSFAISKSMPWKRSVQVLRTMDQVRFRKEKWVTKKSPGKLVKDRICSGYLLCTKRMLDQMCFSWSTLKKMQKKIMKNATLPKKKKVVLGIHHCQKTSGDFSRIFPSVQTDGPR